jgi:lipopolysaccharide export system protein LptA
LLTAVAGLSAADERISMPSLDETVTIEAREAWEDEAPDIVHFRGNFKLITKEWSIFADQATLYGKLDDPETVLLTGSPAVIVIRSSTQGEERAVSGEASSMVYQKGPNSIQLNGSARLSNNDSTLRGNEIEYQIDSDLINAGGEEGIHIRIDTLDQL